MRLTLHVMWGNHQWPWGDLVLAKVSKPGDSSHGELVYTRDTPALIAAIVFCTSLAEYWADVCHGNKHIWYSVFTHNGSCKCCLRGSDDRWIFQKYRRRWDSKSPEYYIEIFISLVDCASLISTMGTIFKIHTPTIHKINCYLNQSRNLQA